MLFVGNIDRAMFRRISTEITTEQVIITEERIDHCNLHDQAYRRFRPYIQQVLIDPDFIFLDTRPNTAVLIRSIDLTGKSLQLILRLHVSSDQPGYMNSVISFWDISERRRKRYERNKMVIYKRGER